MFKKLLPLKVEQRLNEADEKRQGQKYKQDQEKHTGVVGKSFNPRYRINQNNALSHCSVCNFPRRSPLCCFSSLSGNH